MNRLAESMLNLIQAFDIELSWAHGKAGLSAKTIAPDRMSPQWIREAHMTDLRFTPQLPSGAEDPAGHSPSVNSSDQRALMDEMHTTGPAEEPSFSITLDESADVFIATKDDVEFGGVLFAERDDRVLLLATSILPEFRGKGLAAALTRRVLDRLHAEGKRVTVKCPVFRSFVQHHPDYAARLDDQPGREQGADA